MYGIGTKTIHMQCNIKSEFQNKMTIYKLNAKFMIGIIIGNKKKMHMIWRHNESELNYSSNR